MARLPSYQYLIQQIGSDIVVFEEGSEREIARFTANNGNEVARGQKVIYDSELCDEDKHFAALWSGYFYAYACMDHPLLHIEELTLGYLRDKIRAEIGREEYEEQLRVEDNYTPEEYDPGPEVDDVGGMSERLPPYSDSWMI